MTGASVTTDAVPAISDAQRIEIDRGAERAKRFAFAPKLARFNGIVIGLFALVSLMSAVFDIASLLVAAPLAAIAFVEMTGGQRVERYERRGLVQLALNQLSLVGLVAIYGLLQIASAQQSQSPIADMLAQGGMHPEELDMSALTAELGDMDGLYRSAVTAFYGVVIAVTALSQGACAYYYHSRLKHLDAFLAETPRWVVDYLRGRGR